MASLSSIAHHNVQNEVLDQKEGAMKTAVQSPVLELLPLAVVSGGQVQIRWAGLAWH